MKRKGTNPDNLETREVKLSVSTAAEKTNPVSGESNSSQSGEEERGDLIQFYNTVFILKMKSFALRYATHDNRV